MVVVAVVVTMCIVGVDVTAAGVPAVSAPTVALVDGVVPPSPPPRATNFFSASTGNDILIHFHLLHSSTLLPSLSFLLTFVHVCDHRFSGSGGNAVVVGHDFLLSSSTHDDGRRAFTLMNFDTSIAAAPTIVLLTATVNTTAEPTKVGAAQ
jgi:hypothetical protein